MTSLLFITAPNADYKAINLALHETAGWTGGTSDPFHLVTTKNAYMLDAAPGSRGRLEETAAGDVDSCMENPWAGERLSDVEEFCFDLGRSKPKHYQPSMFGVLDAAGFEKKEVIICLQIWKTVKVKVDKLDGPGAATTVVKRKTAWLKKYRKMRIPWNVTNITFCLLDIGHKGWEDFGRKLKARDGDIADGQAENRKNGWYECVNFLELPLSKEEALWKEQQYEWLKDEGLIEGNKD